MRSPAERTTAAPRWGTLTALTTGVLLVHLYVLTGGWPDAMDAGTAITPDLATGAATPATPNAPDKASPTTASLAAPITSSRVRWIVPAPPAPAPPPLAKSPPPKPRPAPPPPPPPVEPVSEGVETPPPLTEAPLPLAEPPAPEQNDLSPVAPGDEPVSTPMPATALAADGRAGPDGSADPAAAGSGAAPAPPPLPQTAEEPAVAEQALPPAQVPPSMRLMYEVTGRVKGINYNASGSLDWENQGDRYAAHMVVRALFVGSREQTSVGALSPTGLVPERFGDKSRTERAAHFDGENRRIRFSNNAPDAAWVAGGQDRLSVFMQLAALLQARPSAYPPGTVVSLQVAGPGDAEIWRFEMGEEETLTLPAGPMKARHIKRSPRKPFDTQTELWLAPQLNHLPVRIRITQHNGDHVEQALRYLP